LIPDKNKTLKYRNILSINSNKICGISWKSKNENIGDLKSVNIEDLLPIFKIRNLQFVDLQYGDTTEEKSVLKNADIEIKKIDEIDNFSDIDSLTSLIDACDFVVTTSNVTAHLAGAIGKETFLILPYSDGVLWYWHYGDRKSLWYPSINQYFKTDLEDWGPIIKEISEAIKEKIS
jgi:ADP-heptose:LPS heptosyltransferase